MSPPRGFSHRWFFILAGLCFICAIFVIWATLVVKYHPRASSQTMMVLANRGSLRQPVLITVNPFNASKFENYIIANENSSTCSDRIGLHRILKYRDSFRQHTQAFCRGGSSSVQCDATVDLRSVSNDYICIGENLHMNMVDLGNRTKHDRLRLYGDCSITEELGRVKFVEVYSDPNLQMQDFKGIPESGKESDETLGTHTKNL
ncbi:hypothetical protein FOL47_001129 [Perkinsus chesapeaki]|uniref:Uncharacterized protein n=1 Tax=Perkinsus chesapeaki TaxID=330153 RepID=A0A7J6MJY2_PERCH|nr:hypothetical protein FOL47_001129 [Perkinsus chesapeaki]